MGMRINTNMPSISAQRTLGISNRKQADALSKLSSGSRITKAADDAAGLAISEKLKADVRSMKQANRNANDGISFIQTAEGGLAEVSNIMIRLRELAIQSSSDTVGDVERGFADAEFQNLLQEVQRISQATEFNGKKLLNGEADKFEFQIGINNVESEDRVVYRADLTDATLNSLGLEGLSITGKDSARGSLDTIDQAISNVSGQRAELGAVQNRLTSTINNIQIATENLSAANSRIRDTDYAEMTAENAKYNVLTQSGTAVLAQANQFGAQALRLIG